MGCLVPLRADVVAFLVEFDEIKIAQVMEGAPGLSGDCREQSDRPQKIAVWRAKKKRGQDLILDGGVNRRPASFAPRGTAKNWGAPGTGLRLPSPTQGLGAGHSARYAFGRFENEFARRCGRRGAGVVLGPQHWHPPVFDNVFLRLRSKGPGFLQSGHGCFSFPRGQN